MDNMQQKMETHLHYAVQKSESNSQYDEYVKILLSDKQVLARIMKYTVEELRDYDIEFIMDCIEGEVEVSKYTVRPQLPKKEKITGMNTESTIPGEGKATFDIRFAVVIPDYEMLKLIINVEAQKQYHEGYSFGSRGMFYCARMISEQLDTEFSADDYDNIKKVYSIWICINAPERYANTISQYSMEEHSVYGEFKGHENVDLISIVIIRLSEQGNCDDKNPLIKMLTVLLSHELEANVKIKCLENEFDMKMEKQIEGRVKKMCNLSEFIVEDTTRKVTQSVTMKNLIQSVENIMESCGFTVERACEALKTTVEEYKCAKEIMG